LATAARLTRDFFPKFIMRWAKATQKDNKMNAVEIIKKYKLVPVAVFNSVESGLESLAALRAGGLPIAEITFRTDCAAEAISRGVKQFPDMLIGAGTVINAAQCKAAIDAGAKFIVGPGLSGEVCLECQKQNVPYIPGVVTPTEIITALSYGLTLLKFFPAGEFGGLKTIKALSAAFPSVSFMPTGGITKDNINEYLSFNKIVAAGGSFMMKGTPADIEKQTREAMEAIRG
jgi:2-dehydro-3-deoxyphosphogluconate aldolase/(4S)-4-hydroxy-2-oxoglutarate aldolase